MALSYDLEHTRTALEDVLHRLLASVESASEYDLLGASLCHGWSRLEVVVHLLGGWQEMLGGMVSPVRETPTVDAASYWTAFADDFGGEDRVEVLMAQRRRASSYARPAAAVTQLRDVGDALLRGLAVTRDQPCTWQGHVFTAGDFLAIWVVEDVVHHLDLDLGDAPPAAGLAVARATIEELAGCSLPATWDDPTAVLIGTGRRPAPDDAEALQDRLPALR